MRKLWESLPWLCKCRLKHKGKIHDESAANGTSVRDYIENTFNISL